METLFWIVGVLSGIYLVGLLAAVIFSQGTITFDWPLELLSRFRKSR